MAITIEEKVTLEVDTCCVCGVSHAIPKEIRDHAYKHGGRWYCPNGHHIGWNKKDSQSETDKVRIELQKSQKEIALLQSRIDFKHNQAESLTRALSAQKGQTTRLKNRINNGVCPCCNRHFTNLERHIKGQHPEFATEKL
jgi:hypothetical protein